MPKNTFESLKRNLESSSEVTTTQTSPRKRFRFAHLSEELKLRVFQEVGSNDPYRAGRGQTKNRWEAITATVNREIIPFVNRGEYEGMTVQPASLQEYFNQALTEYRNEFYLKERTGEGDAADARINRVLREILEARALYDLESKEKDIENGDQAQEDALYGGLCMPLASTTNSPESVISSLSSDLSDAQTLSRHWKESERIKEEIQAVS